MKLLVTGAKGQVGSSLCRLGAGSGFEIIGLDSAELDICKPAAIAVALTKYQPDVLINAAAYTAVDKAESELEKAELVNGLAAGYLAEACAKRNIPLIHISTDYVFDGLKMWPYAETDTVNPLGVYGCTKLQGEQLVQQHHSSSIILRTSWVFGLEGKNFPKTMLKLAKDRSEFGVVVDQVGCPTFADDITRAILALASQYGLAKTLPWGIYHYAGREPCSWHGLAAYIFEHAQSRGMIKTVPALKALTTREYPTLARRPANSVLDCAKFTRSFPETPLSDWRAGIRALLESY